MSGLLVLVLVLGLTVPLATPARAEIQAGDPLADILFVIDESGSMGNDQQDVRDNVDFIAERVDAFVDAQFGWSVSALRRPTGPPGGGAIPTRRR